MKAYHSSILAALVLLPVSLSSCAPLGDFLLGGAQGPARTGEAQAEPEASAAPSAAPAEKTSTAVLPGDTTFSHGQWRVMRTSRALYGWTGAGEQLVVFAVELRDDSACWYSQRGNGPEAIHCPDYDGPLASVKSSRNGVEETSVFAGFDQPPWKGAVAGVPLPAASSLPDVPGNTVGSIERGADDEVTVQVRSWSSGVFALSPGGALLVGGVAPDLFDGCASADGTIAVMGATRVQIGKKKCGVFRSFTGTRTTLKLDLLEIVFSRKDEAPNLAEERAGAAKARKALAGTQSQVDVSGGADKTLVSVAAKKANGDGLSMVEAVATVQGAHYKCKSSVDRFDPKWVQTVKAICGSMAK